MPDLQELLRNEYGAAREDIRAYGDKLRGKRKKLGPRNRKALREHVLNQEAGEGLAMIQQMYEAAKHQDGEQTPCAACRFLEGK